MAPKMQRQRGRSSSSIIRADRQAERQTEWQTGKLAKKSRRGVMDMGRAAGTALGTEAAGV